MAGEYEHFAVEDSDGASLVTFPSHRLSSSTTIELHEAKDALFASSPPRLIMDFRDVPVVPSGMLGMVMSLKKDVEARGGRIAVIVGDQKVRDMFCLLRLDESVVIVDSLDAARQAVAID